MYLFCFVLGYNIRVEFQALVIAPPPGGEGGGASRDHGRQRTQRTTKQDKLLLAQRSTRERVGLPQSSQSVARQETEITARLPDREAVKVEGSFLGETSRAG